MALVSPTDQTAGHNFGDDLAFVQKYQAPVVLSSPDGSAKVLVVPGYQGRVITSTAGGDHGFSFGWINRELIASGKIRPHFNAHGGEDRMWLGPEGGPYALFFTKSAPAQTFEYWQTPALIDTASWQVAERSASSVRVTAGDRLTNRAGTVLEVKIERTVRLLDRADTMRLLDTNIPPTIRFVGYESDNVLHNAGRDPWTAEKGMPSIWILGMFQSGPRATIVLPYRTTDACLKPPVQSDYFGPIGQNRLQVGSKAIFYRADAKSRGKIGVPPGRACPIAGSWEAAQGVLTLVLFDLPPDAEQQPYVDSRWIDMPEPYAGDVVNAYNDGPPAPDAPQLGAFYELESSSPAAALGSGDSTRHRHRTFHFQGDRSALDQLARGTLGVSLDEIEKAFDGK